MTIFVPPLPKDLIEWLRMVFADCNLRASRKLSCAPKADEEDIDLALIENLSFYETPRTFSSGYCASLHTVFVGGKSRYPGAWGKGREVGDLAVVVRLVRAGRLRGSKVAFLQSKKLYHREFTQRGMPDPIASPFGGPELPSLLNRRRTFRFDERSRYEALRVDDDQWRTINQFQYDLRHDSPVPVYYLMYNPLVLPWTLRSPMRPVETTGTWSEVGCRVVPAEVLHRALQSKSAGYSPSYQDLCNVGVVPGLPPPGIVGWRLEDFVADYLLRCREGRETREDEWWWETMIYERAAPAEAVVVLTVEEPENDPNREG